MLSLSLCTQSIDRSDTLSTGRSIIRDDRDDEDDDGDDDDDDDDDDDADDIFSLC